MRKVVLDTNCYVDALRDMGARQELEAFLLRAAPQLYLSAVVAAELRVGARTASDRRSIETHVLEPLLRRGRILTPTLRAWDALGLTLGELRTQEGLQPSAVSRSFSFDILLAYSCREAGATLITKNARDMERIRRIFVFEFAHPFPDAL